MGFDVNGLYTQLPTSRSKEEGVGVRGKYGDNLGFSEECLGASKTPM